MTIDWRETQRPFNKMVTKASQYHATKVYPEESVGIVVDNTYIPLENTHIDPINNFKISTKVLIEYENKIQAIIHSHPDPHPMFPSYLDQRTQIAWDIPFGIQLINKEGAGNIIWWGDTLPVSDYIGRPYIFGVYDCFSIWRDYFRQELNIHVANIPRDENFWLNGDDLYGDNSEKMGFYKVDLKDIKPYDLIFTKIRSRKLVNHGILYLGGEVGLHHMPYKLSSKDNISKFMDPNKEIFDSVWRHKEL